MSVFEFLLDATDVRDAVTSLDTALAKFLDAQSAVENMGGRIVLTLLVFDVHISMKNTAPLIYVASPTLPPFLGAHILLQVKHQTKDHTCCPGGIFDTAQQIAVIFCPGRQGVGSV